MIQRASESGLAMARRAIFLAALMLAAAASTAALKPASRPMVATPDLEALLPEAFAEWRRVPIADAVLPKELELGPGESVAYRAYADELGRIVTLVVAYGPPLGDSVRLHRPESCYVAQGFALRSRAVVRLDIPGVDVRAVHLGTDGPSHDEAVTYWLRSGMAFVTTPAAPQWLAFGAGGERRLDGALVRASMRGDDAVLFDLQAKFLSAFAGALGPEGRAVFLGSAGAS
jgi:EpsI family protein